MKEDLLPYYENELSFIRNMGKEFAASWGKIAERLALEPGKCDDPHVERLIEAFALLAGRIHHKIDDEFPEITESLLNVLYPHYLRPIPSMSIAQFRVDPDQGPLSTGYTIKKNTGLSTRQVAGRSTSCSFRTCYPVTLWPLEVASASVRPAAAVPGVPVTGEAVAIIRLTMKCLGTSRLSGLALDKLRFYLHAESAVAHTLYELLFANVVRVVLRNQVHAIDLPSDGIRAVGFGRDEGMLPYPDRSFLGYRVLQEYFSFPSKYLFFDISGFNRIDRADRSRFGDSFDLLLYLGSFERRERLQDLEQQVNADTFQLGCTPIINLFERLAEPVRLTHTATEYRIVPDVNRQPSTEVYSVDEVTSTAPYLQTPQVYRPFYSTRHVYDEAPGEAYWYASRRRSERKGDKGTEVYLSLVNMGFKPTLPPCETLSVRVTCTNRDLAGDLPFLGEFGELAGDSGPLVRARTLLAPTKTIRPPLRRGLQWRLISHLALNHLSLAEGSPEALQEILNLYDFSEDPTIRKQIAGIVRLSTEPHLTPRVSEHGVVFAKGLRINMEFDEDAFIGAGVFLFAAVLESFLGLYTAINSFTQVTVRTRQRKGDVKRWPPRSGEQILL